MELPSTYKGDRGNGCQCGELFYLLTLPSKILNWCEAPESPSSSSIVFNVSLSERFSLNCPRNAEFETLKKISLNSLRDTPTPRSAGAASHTPHAHHDSMSRSWKLLRSNYTAAFSSIRFCTHLEFEDFPNLSYLTTCARFSVPSM